MSNKLTATKLKMAAMGNHMTEVGKEIYIDNPKDSKLGKSSNKGTK